MNSRRWQDQFQDADRASQAFADSGAASALAYALEQKVIPETDYFAWAQEVYELPFLKMSFFSDHQANPTIWQKWKDKYSWKADCLPLSEWEGILYVACLEPHTFPESISAVCLLTPPAGLKQMWMNYQSQTAFELQDIQTSVGAPPPGSMAEDLFDPPSGMTEPDKSAAAAPASPLVSLEPLDNSEKAAPAQQPVQTFASGGLLQKNPEPVPAAAVAVEAPAPAPAPASAPTPVMEPTPEAVAVASATAVKETKEVKAKPAVAMQKTNGPQKATPRAVSTSVYFLDTLLKKESSPIKNPRIFADMKTHFKKSLILAVDTLGKTAKVLLWDENFQAPSGLTEISLIEPSIFRIAVTTQHPYHGHIVQNSINDQFFTEWNQAQIPDHITLVPILLHENVVGLVMGFAEAESSTREVLQFAEKLTSNITLQIESVSPKAA